MKFLGNIIYEQNFYRCCCCYFIRGNMFQHTSSWTIKVNFNVVNTLISDKYSVNTNSLISHIHREAVPNDTQ